MAASTSAKFPELNPDTAHLPRLLWLHGGGVNGSIFEAQSRAVLRHLSHSFRPVFAEGPFLCDPHSDVVVVYGSYAPFRRWLRWLPEHPDIDDDSVIDEIGYSIRTAMENDDRAGGRGEWVGLVGFSQGAKLAASLLLEQQTRHERNVGSDGPIGVPGLRWRFGILLAGRAPLSNLNPDILTMPELVLAGALSEGFMFPSDSKYEAMLRVPTLHVHGLQDPGLALHRQLLHKYCDDESTTLVEWDGGHRMVLKSGDVGKVVSAIYDVAESTGVPVERTV